MGEDLEGEDAGLVGELHLAGTRVAIEERADLAVEGGPVLRRRSHG